jgi:hypothetical protein
MSDRHDSHSWDYDRTFNAAKCKDCGLKCSRARGGDGWPAGDWRYYDSKGGYTGLYHCPHPWPKSKPRPGKVRIKVSDLTLDLSVAEATKLRYRIDAALKRSTP